MIIAHYPGAGGHRYGRFRKQMSFNHAGCHMHYSEFITCPGHRYITDNTEKNQVVHPDEIKHTHTLNDALLLRFFPGHEIIKIKADLKKSLRREWQVVMKFLYVKHSIEQQVAQMFDMIVWHHRYYNLYPVDWTQGTVVDIDTDASEFGKVMRRELDIVNPLFDFAWQCFVQHGPSARINDFYKEYEQRQSK